MPGPSLIQEQMTALIQGVCAFALDGAASQTGHPQHGP